jgi:hypothetical protein
MNASILYNNTLSFIVIALMNTLMTYFYFSIIEMLNAATRTPRSGTSPNFVHAMNNDAGLANNRRTDPFSFPANDKTGAHSIAALDRYICDSKNGSIYSDNIKAAIGEAPTMVNPYIPTKTYKPLPQESFRSPKGRFANSCGCNRRRNQLPDGTNVESFCGNLFIENKDKILGTGPIVLVVLIVIGVILLYFLIRKKAYTSSYSTSYYDDYDDGAYNRSGRYEPLIGGGEEEKQEEVNEGFEVI